ncbi:hypothetical protein GCM10009604_06790 [Corynebacterium aurimucosum]|uniref:hypothetical protein n=1 Tax=Corynebacterium aurimucosum TaxID=169292 RepID=UPI00191CE3FF|nr:hypothetical protein [Corynebacterium aurimucosum]QQU95553.1 hypothetical protein I6I66_12625 [Corynebacterium aurimucosum]UTA71551.1 hypothetical protein J3S22_00055 [Corynebacterium aurimucosum]WJY69761.1 hypothetical protein CAURIM_03120 [Corynebacterium aurimucosum]
MKHINRTLTAAVLAGSLALGGTAVASAQIPAPAEFELDGVTYRQQSDGSYLSVNELGQTPLSKDQAQAAWENSPEYQELLKETSNQGEDPAEGESPSNNEEGSADGDNSNNNGSTDGDNSNNNNSSEGESDFDKKQLAWLALPAALVIGGVTWYLAKDGKTYVKSQEAAQKDAPTAEEKAASEQMLQENKDEVIAQGGQIADSTAAQAPAQTRGISAETGSNTVARGLAALAFAAMIAAGAFAARRKFFA